MGVDMIIPGDATIIDFTLASLLSLPVTFFIAKAVTRFTKSWTDIPSVDCEEVEKYVGVNPEADSEYCKVKRRRQYQKVLRPILQLILQELTFLNGINFCQKLIHLLSSLKKNCL